MNEVLRKRGITWFIGLAVFFKLPNKAVKVLLFADAVLERALLEVGVVSLGEDKCELLDEERRSERVGYKIVDLEMIYG